MKLAKEWLKEIEDAVMLYEHAGPEAEAVIKRIQADALIHAALICDSQFEPREGEGEDYSNGHANRGVGNCQDAIHTEAESLN